MKNRRSPSGLRLVVGFGAAIGLSLSLALVHVAAQSGQGLPVPIPGKNVNMVSGTTLPGGDPFLQRQNEPSISVSTRNPLHLFGASNDYRTVDIPGLGEEVTGDAWIGIFKSFDGGATWKSSLLPGFRQDVSQDGIHSPLYGLEAAADPVIRAGTNGLFYMGGMAFNRDQDDGKVFVARYIDNNNREAGDSISYIGTTVIDTGSETRFLDKPWIAVDIPRAMKGNGKPDKNDHRKDDKDKSKDKYGRVNEKDDKTRKPTTGPVCQIPGQAQPIPAGTIYVMYSAFLDPVGGSANLPPRVDRAEDERDRNEGGQRKRRERENGEDHTPGQPMEGRTLIMLSRSTDCGRTFSRPQKISERTQINQGSVAAIDPNTGTIYVAWREFLSNAQPDAILVTKSTDGGDSFSSPVRVALIHPFDQASSATKFRTNSYPTMTVDATGRVYVAWAERGIGPMINGQGGDARIVIATSTDGKKWSAPTPADNPQQRGHQFMPVLSFGGGRLHLVWWDQRDDRSKMWGTFIDEAPILNWVGAPADRPSRHTIDLRGAQGLPGAAPQFGPSVRVSNYLEGVRAGKTEPEQLQFNAPNLPLFALGTTPFIGDYLDVSMSPAFIANGDGTWRYNTLASDPSLFFTSWSDNRDVRKPADGNWAHYTPPTFAGYTGTSIFDPTQPAAVCSQGQAGMRDQNVYSSRVQSGLVIATLGNTKPLGYVTAIDGTRQLIQRTFVVTVSNPDPPVRQPNGTITGYKDIVLHINAQPVGGRASFLQFEPLIDLPVRIAPRSSISRDVFVTSTDRDASVPVTVTEGASTATSAKLIINPDITNPDIENPDIENPDIENPDITNAEAHAITVSNPDITNPDIENLAKANPDIENPDIENPDIENPDITNPDIINPDIENPDIENPDIENPDIENPDIENPDIENAALTDVTWNVSNVGNTATSYQVKLLLKQAQQQRLVNAGVKFQLVVTKNTASPVLAKDLCEVKSPNRNLTVVTINSPTFIDPQDSQAFSTIVNPDIENPDIENATLALAPGDTARVTLRVYSPVGDTTTDPTPDPSVENPLTELTGALEDLKTLGVVTTSHPVDTIAVQQGSTTPVVTASIPIIVTTTLPDATRTVAYAATLVQTGSTPPFSFAVTTGALPPGLTLQPDGHIVGTPLASGSYAFTVRLTDSAEQEASATLAIRVFEPVVVGAGTLSGAVVNQSYSTSLSASGGFPPFVWSPTGGTLPTGVALSPAGVVAGTPTQSGTFTFTAQAMDIADPSQVAAASLVLNVAPTANPQTATVAEDTATTITVSGTGAAQGAFTFAIGNQPAHGTMTGTGPAFSYTPASNYTGPDSFTFRLSQGSLTSAFATVTINVTASNDAPVATPQTVNTPQGVARAITLTGTDPENSPLTFAIVTAPTSGTLTGAAPNVTYTPAAGFTGTATFTFRVNDGTVNSAPATVSVIVGPPPAGSADVTLTLVDAPDPAAIGGNVTYTATLHNNGPATANAVTFTLAYPAADLQRISVTPSQGTCGTSNPITCTIGAIANGGNVTVPVVLRAFNRGGTFVVTSSTSAGAQLDYNTSNNIASQSTLVNGPATPSTDLHVQQTSAPNPVVFGGNTVYTIVVANNGPSDATGVSLTNTFTAATAQFVSATASQGSCSAGGNQVSCNVGGLIAGAFATYTVTLRANGSGTLSNTAVVTGSQADPSAADNSSTLATTISNRGPVANNDVATVNEDAPATTIFALSNDTDADGDALTVTGVTPGDNTHGTVQLAGTNAVSYTPAGNYSGPASFGYAISDGHGGTANATVNVTVLSVNDAPSFVAGPNQSTGENSGAQTIPGWATAIAAGAVGANEGSQTVSFIVANNNHSLFSSQPAVSPAGTLTYTAAASGTGTATVTVTAQDNGGTDNGGVDSSASQTFTITIGSTNDAPGFTAGPSQTIPEDAPLQTVPNWATFISAGPPDEAGQLIDFIVTNDNNALFTAQPSVSPTGTLTYRPAANAFGSATVTVRVHDNGGTTPGVDTSAPQTFVITVTPVNDNPVANDDTSEAVGGEVITIAVLDNDTDVDHDSLAVTNVSAPAHGTAVVVADGGAVTYTPAAGYNGPDSFTYTISDGHGGTSTATVHLLVTFTSCSAATFSGPVSVGIGTAPGAFPATGDLNHDGYPDLVVNGGASATAVTVLLGGAAGLGSPTSYETGGTTRWPAIADFDGDGNPDIAVAALSANAIVMLRGDGAGHFTVAPATGTTNITAPFFLGTANLNADSMPDLVSGEANPSPGAVVLVNQSTPGTFAFAATRYAQPSGSPSMILADFDGDADIDIALGRSNTNTITVLLNDGTGAFASSAQVPAAPATFSANVDRIRDIGDLNADGRIDLGVKLHDGSFLVLLRNPAGGFNPPVTITPPSAEFANFDTGFEASADFNGDGHADLARIVFATNSMQEATQILLGDGTGTNFTLSETLLVRLQDKFAIADFNQDGRPDLAALRTDAGAPAVLVFLNTCGAATLSDLSVQMSGPEAATSGDTLIYTVTVTNQGPDPAQNVLIHDAVGFQGMTLLGGTPSQGACAVLGGTLECAAGSLANGGSMSVEVSIRATIAGQLTNIAMAHSDGADGDPNDNTSSLLTSVAPVVTATNDAPSFNAGPSQTVLEDATVQTVPNWATSISAGPPDESGQLVDFIVTNDNTALFMTQPAVSPAGTLTYRPAANASGSATVTVRAHDNGGTANGGVDTSAPQTFVITVTPVNDAPTFTAGANVTTREDAGAFVPSANAGAERSTHTATLLADGRVLIAGGVTDPGALASAELYDPDTRTQTPTGSLNQARFFHSATLLSNGQVLVAGGVADGAQMASAELFNPATGQFTPTGSLGAVRHAHIAALLPSGRVLIAGGLGPNFQLTTAAEIFDPLTNSFAPTGPMAFARTAASSVTLADGRVLMLGGWGLGGLNVPAAEIYNEGTGQFTTVGSLATARLGETATLLPNNLVLVAGGADDAGNVLASSELFNPATSQFTAGPVMAAARYTSAAARLGDGTVLIAAGFGGPNYATGTYLSTAEIYNPAANTFTPTGGLAIDRTNHQLTALNDGSALITGGYNATIFHGTSELYVRPGPQVLPNWATGISAGPPGEAGQLNFVVTNDNDNLFDVQPAIDPSGTLTFTAVANASGSANVTLTLHDDGGIANGGADTSAPQQFVITVAPVNDPPRFVKVGGNQVVLEDSGIQIVPGWATSINAGSEDESGQALGFNVTNDNNGLFEVQPSVETDGTLRFRPAPNAFGHATLSVQLQDDGGVANGGVNVSATETFAIDVLPVNDRPRFNPFGGAYQAPAITTPQVVPGWASGMNPGPFNEIAQAVSFIVSNANNALFSAQPSIAPDGTLSFTLAPGASGGATVSVSIHDDGGTLNGGFDTSLPQTFDIIVSAASTTADLDVSITDSQDPVAPGAQYSYSATIHNSGPGAATGVLFTINVSANVTVHAISGPGVCEQTGAGQFTCGTGAIASGATVIYGVATSASLGTATATASVTSSSTDPNQANDSAQESTTINRPPTGVPDNNTTASGVAVDTNVLANDIDLDIALGDVLHIASIGGAQHGIVSTSTGSPLVRYTPEPGFTGIDTFNYAIVDTAGATSALTTVTVLVSQAICAAEPSGLISWWPGTMDVTASDIRGGNNGTPQGVVSTAPGIVGNAFSFNRTPGSGILVPNASNLNPSQITLAAWVRPAATVEDYQSIIRKTGSYALGLTNNAYAVCEIGSLFLPGGSVPAGQWSHVVCTYDGISLQLYVNGVQVSSLPNDQGIPLNTTALMIGGDALSGSNGFNGLIDEAQVFGRALPIEEILTIVNTGDAGLCQDQSAVVTDDTITVTSDTTVTVNPSANDRDPDVAFPSVLATVRGLAPGTPQLWSPGDIGLVASTGLAYFSGGLGATAASGAIGILDTNTNTIVGSMSMPVPSAQTLARVNQTTNIVYFRGTNLNAVDGRPGSPTFNQVILSLALGSVQSMALDETRGRLYLTSNTGATAGSLFNSRFIVLDVNPLSPTFHQVVDQFAAPGGGNGLSVGVNTITNKVYAAVSGGTASGVYVLDVATNTWALIPLTTNPSTLLVNDANNLVYAVTGTSLYVIDGATSTRIALITLPAGGSAGTIDTRLAVHKALGRVYVRLSEFPAASRLAVIDGNRASPTFNTILTTLALGREDGQTMVVVDEANNRVITTSKSDLRTTVINATTNAIVGTVQSTQPSQRVVLDAAHHRAYIIGGVTTIRSVDVTTGALQAVLQVASEVSPLAVNTTTHTAYVPQTTTGAGIALINQNGLAGSIALPHVDGREVFAVRNRVTNRIYVLNSSATAAGGSDGLPGFVHVIDGNSNAVIASVPVGPFPFGIGINEATNKIYVGNAFDGTAFPGGITVIDGATNTTVQADMSQIPTTSGTPGQLSIGRDIVPNPVTGKVYFRITGGSTETLGELDGTTNVATAIDNDPFYIVRVNPVLNKLYVGGLEGGESIPQVFIVDGATEEAVAGPQIGSPTPFIGTQSYLAVNVTTGRVFVADYDHDVVSVIDGTTDAVIATIAVGDGPSTVAVNETLNRIYVGNALDKTLTIIDGNTLRVAATLTLPLIPVRLEVDESVSQIYALASLIDPGVMVISDPGTTAPAIASVTNGGAGTTVLNADGSVTYTPNAGYAGDDTFTYTIPDGLGGSRTGTVHVTVAAPLNITTTPSLPSTAVGQAYPGAGLTVLAGTAPYAWSVVSGQLPPGLVLNAATGLITGTAVQNGSFTFTAQARDSSNPPRTATQTFTIIVAPPVIVTSTLPSGFVNTAYNAQVVAGGATTALVWTLNTNNNPLLSWLSITNAGVLTGTPPAVGSTPPFTVTATDANNQSASRSLSLFVSGPLDIEPLREGVVLESEPAMSIIGGRGTRAVSVTSGALPPGLVLTSSGSFTGTPARHGSFNFTVELRDCTANTCFPDETPEVVSKNMSLRVSAKDQQGSSQTQPAITFGGPGGRRMAQVVTVGANGTLTGIGLQNITCPSVTPVTIELQRLTFTGLPDGTTIATGSATGNYNAIAVLPTLNMSIDEKFAFIVSSPVACTFINAATIDQYNAGDAYVDAGGGWVSLLSTDGRYDIPSFRTLIQPAKDVGYLTTLRSAGATFTLLNNGRVLITGTGTPSAEIYDPATNTSALTGSMSNARTQHTATLLQDGTVLIAGGQLNGNRLATAETYDPATGTFTATANSMFVARDVHTATRLNDGRVLITGGNINFGTSSLAIASTEIYDPVTRTFAAGPNMTSTRQVHNAVLLQSGKVLVASGFVGTVNGISRNAEIYDPVANTFTATAGQMSFSRGWSAAELLADGRVLITGGQSGPVRNTAEIYNPVTDSFTAAGSMATPRLMQSMTRLADGSVLVAGGFEEPSVASYVLPLASMERYIPETNTFVNAGAMETRRARHGAIRLPSGAVFLVGSSSQSWMTNDTGELYTLAGTPSLNQTTPPDGQIGIAYPATTLTASGGSGGPYQIQLVSGILPPGMNYDQSTATISGTPGADGLYVVGFRVTDSANQASVQSLSIRIGTALVISSPYNLTTGALNHPYDLQLTATGGTAPVVWSLAPASTALPAGLVVNADGRITGTPTEVVNRNIVIRAVDAIGRTALKSFNLNVQNPLDITTTILPEAAVKESYTFCLSTTNGTGAFTWSISGGTLPPGVTLPNNCFANPPQALGTYDFTVQVTDLASPPQVVTRDFSIRVSAKDQEGFSQTQPVISFGGAGGRRLAQTVTVGANGTLTAFGMNSTTSCVTPNTFTVDVQRLDASGKPDGTTIATGSTTGNLGGIALSALTVGVGDRLAFILSSSSTCTIANVPATSDNYQAGEALANPGAGWVTLLSTDGRYDIPFRTMITPATEVAFLNRSRNSFEATVLNNGLVLLTSNGNPADLYDPATRTITPTGNMITPRSNHTATLLANGTVLLAGGRDFNSNQLTSAEIYDPATGAFTATAGVMASAHESGRATRLNDGRVLITGGRVPIGAATTNSSAADIYDPATGTFTSVGPMLTERNVHTSTLLASGKVLIAGGYTSGPVFRSAELYDPATGTFTGTAGSMTSRGVAAAALLADGRVLITGGQAGDLVNTAEIYDPLTDSFTTTGNMNNRRYIHTATTLADGSVLIAGGFDEVNASSYILPLASMERYLPGSGTFVPAGGMETRRAYHAAALLQDGRVLLAGGSSQSWMSGNTVELYDPAIALSLNPATLPDAQPGVAYTPVTLSASGGTAPHQITLSSGALPQGMAYDSQTFVVSGTPAANVLGTFALGFRVSDSASHSTVQSIPLRVGSPNTITSPYRLTDATLGLSYSLQLAATGPAPITWFAGPPSGLPPGLTLSASGLISGTPNTQAFYNFAVRAVDAQGRVAIKTLSINVIAPMTITTATLSDGLAANGSYGGCVNRSNGVSPVTFSLSGQIPAGMLLQSNGCFDGTFPAQALREGGTFTFTVTATDSGTTPQVVSRDYTIRVHTDDQWPTSQSVANVALPASRRIAQVFATGTPFGLSGASIYNIASCSPNMQITLSAYPTIGTPARPDESGLPLATASVTTSSSGTFGTRLYFPTALPMPQHSPVAIVASFAGGSCQGVGWPTSDWYPQGSGWVDDGGGWQPSSTAIGRPDVLLTTLSVPDAGLRFTPYWRGSPVSALLTNGRVLMLGNEQPAEIFDPSTQSIALTTGSMVQTRADETATVMPNGNVLIVGGSRWDGSHTVALATTEIYNPGTGTFTAGPNLPSGRSQHRATLLTNGRLLITGGWNTDASFNWVGVPNAWLLDASGNLIATVATAGARYSHSATRLADGKVLIAGGYGLNPPISVSAEIYDPAVGANGTFTATVSPMLTWSGEHTATLLTSGTRAGQVLIAGGGGTYPALRQSSEFFNPTTMSFVAGPSPLEPRLNPTATALADGHIVIAGGQTDWITNQFASSIEIYDPATNAFSSAGDMRVDRSRHTAELISGGRVMFNSGWSLSLTAPRSVEVFDPTNLAFRIATATLPDGITGQGYPATALQATGGSGAGYSFSLAQGNLPAGMSINQNGTISGTPSAGGRQYFSVAVTDSASNVASRGFSITVNRIAITSTSPLPNGSTTANYNFQFAATGAGAITWTLEPGNTLPPNLTLSSSGLLSGPTPSVGGYFFNVRATDSTGQTTVKGFSLQVVP